MRAVILAAGVGSRLQPLTNGCPKCLVAVGGKRLIDYQLEALHAVGVEDIALVIGYQAHQVRDYCGGRVRYLENPHYLTTNSIYSLHLAAVEFDSEVLLFNCDILFSSQVLDRMLAAQWPNVVAVDSQARLITGEMNVAYDRQGRISRISKELDPAGAKALSVQLAKFDAAGADRVRQEVARLVSQQRRNVFPTSAYGPLIRDGLLFAVEAGDLPWGEIDSLEDYRQVAEEVLPRLQDLARHPLG